MGSNESVMYAAIYATVLFGCLSLYQSVNIFIAYRLDAPMFIKMIRKLIQNKDIPRAIKLCAVAPKSPLVLSIKFVLLRQSSLQQKTPEEVKRLCEEAFQSEAGVFAARTALPMLDALIYCGAVALIYCFHPNIPDWMWLLAVPSLVALLAYWLRARTLRELNQYQHTLAEMLTVHLPAGGPYR